MAGSGWQASDGDVAAILAARHGDPFAILGQHRTPEGFAVRAFVPYAETLHAVGPDGREFELEGRPGAAGLFEGLVPDGHVRHALRAENAGGAWDLENPYSFGPVLGALDDHLFVEGTHRELYRWLGAHPCRHEGVDGVRFAVWAPNASRVSVVGDFNDWDGRRLAMRRRVASGLWEVFAPGVKPGTRYKYEVVGRDGALLPLKADPVGFQGEMRPSTASVVADPAPFRWTDARYIAERERGDKRRMPMSTYEVHLGSWKRADGGGFLSYDELAEDLVPYAAGMGFTHLELMPVSEHPLDASWGYQPVGLYAPTARFGDAAGFARFVDRAHAAGLGVIVDWVPAHFPVDVHGLAKFDGTSLYDDADPRRGFHPDGNTGIYDFARAEVAGFLAANAVYWLDRFHVDGLRVDAVASMLYLDSSRKAGEWVPNRDGGNDNRDAVDFLKRVNGLASAAHPGAVTIAEESTSWPGVSRPVSAGGLGFGFKWNMGWMHDTLEFMAEDPVHRRWHHGRMTFGLLYAFSENFVLPLSHDEVVHGKKSIVAKMPGDEWQRFANVRAYYGGRPRPFRAGLAALRRTRRCAGAGRVQLHPGAARRLPARPAAGRALAGTAQHGRRALRRVEPRQPRRRYGEGRAVARAAGLGRGAVAAAGDGVLQLRGGRGPVKVPHARKVLATRDRSEDPRVGGGKRCMTDQRDRLRSPAPPWPTCWPGAAGPACSS